MARCMAFESAVLGLLSCVAQPAQAETDALVPDHARTLAEHAVRANPSVKAIEERIVALDQGVRQATAWTDPKLSVDYSNMPIDAWRPGEHPMSGIQINLQQTFFYPGKVGLRKAAAEGRVREVRATLAERKVQLRAMVERAYYQLALVRQLRQVTDEHVKLVEQFIFTVRSKYEVGKAGQHELIRLQVLGRKLGDDLRNFDRDERALTAEINASLHRATTVPISTPQRLSVVPPPKDSKAIEDQALASRPLLRQLGEQAETRRATARQASREGYPDFTTWVGYRFRAASDNDVGTDFIGFGLSVPIPFWYDRRWGTERRRNEALARSAEMQRTAVFDQIRGALGRAVAGWQRAADQAQVYRTELMPLAQRALDATFAAYQVDRADFASLFQAELQLLEFERTVRRAEAATRILRSEVESLTGAAS